MNLAHIDNFSSTHITGSKRVLRNHQTANTAKYITYE